MTNILEGLYNLARKQHPYEPATGFEQDTAQRLEQALSFQFPENCKNAVFEIEDSLRILGYTESLHAFSLGLTMGLMIAGELRPFQEEL